MFHHIRYGHVNRLDGIRPLAIRDLHLHDVHIIAIRVSRRFKICRRGKIQ
jgi:hypothetical protein